jgi:hypothetical protein
MTTTKAQLQAEIDTLLRIDVHVRTNQGTYGASEAARKVGSGDPRFANREEYETVAGSKRASGPDEDDAPGRMRDIGSRTLIEYRAKVAALRQQMRAAK